MQKVRVFCCGKVNLSLNILGLDGGMHMIDSIMQSIDFGDIITATKRDDSKISIKFIGCKISGDSTVLKAAEALKKYKDFGADITIKKNLPVAGGLGGSSCDCAGALVALNCLFDFESQGANLYSLACSLGSDTGFMLGGGCARITGKGEKVFSIQNNLPLNIVIVRAHGAECSSSAVYKEFDKLQKQAILCNNNSLQDLLNDGDSSALKLFNNGLANAAQRINGNILNAQNALIGAGAVRAVMTGSGSCVAGYFDCDEKAQRAAKMLNGVQCKSINKGIKII